MFAQLKGLKPTARGQMILNILQGLGGVAVMAFFIVSGWALMVMLVP